LPRTATEFVLLLLSGTQNLFNKVLLSNLVRRAVFLPDGSDDAWTRTHADALNLLGRPEDWGSAGDETSDDL
jgi:hypothetical protein